MMSIEESYLSEEVSYTIVPNPVEGAGSTNIISCTLIDTIHQQAVTTILSVPDQSKAPDSIESLLKENALLKRQLSQMQVSTYQESLRIIQLLTLQNEELVKEKEAFGRLLLAEQDKFHQLKTLVEPALKHVMEDVTQDLVKKLMERVPDLNAILLEATKEDGTMNFQQLIDKLEAYKSVEEKKEESKAEPFDDDLSEWQDIIPYDLSETYEHPSTKKALIPYGQHKIDDTPKPLAFASNITFRQRTITIEDVKMSEFDDIINQLKLLQETYGDNPTFHAVKTEEYIIIDGEKLDREGALSLLVSYISMAGKGVAISGKSMFYMMGTIVQLATFVGLGISVFTNPWTAAFMLIGRLSFPILRLAVGI
jgi:hypothetical protein